MNNSKLNSKTKSLYWAPRSSAKTSPSDRETKKWRLSDKRFLNFRWLCIKFGTTKKEFNTYRKKSTASMKRTNNTMRNWEPGDISMLKLMNFKIEIKIYLLDLFSPIPLLKCLTQINLNQAQNQAAMMSSIEVGPSQVTVASINTDFIFYNKNIKW